MVGQTISHYRILEKLGEGGMGVVYKAEDTKLRRTVALKFLPPSATENRERFLREAQAAAALNHPNICTVFEIDDEHGFLAMELIEGVSVKDKIASRPLPLEEALSIAMQACAGLAAAHEKGIVHRDIKPANLMVTAQGHVKLMDFGLAQVGDRTRITKTGSSLGTPAYMSPEQAQGSAVDRRTDIWSLSVVLYEMVSGQAPFPGQTDAAVAYNIVHNSPEPLTARRAGLPVELDRIISKSLAKTADERYQHAEDLAGDLHRLRRLKPVQPVRSFKPWLYSAGGAAIAAAMFFFIPKPADDSLSASASITQLTTYSGTERDGAISPDGNYIAFVSEKSGAPDVWARPVAGGELVQLTRDPANESGLLYSPTGEWIYFVSRNAIWRIPPLGGEARKIVDGGRNPSISADGKKLAYQKGDAVEIANADGTSPRKACDAPGFQAFGVLSPNGRHIALRSGGLFNQSQLSIAGVDGGPPRQITQFTTGQVLSVAWLPDNRHVVYSYSPSSTIPNASDLWLLSIDGGTPRRLSLNHGGQFTSLRFSADGKRLLAGLQKASREVWRAPLGPDPDANGRAAVRLLDDAGDPMWIQAATPSSLLLINGNYTGKRNLWIMPLLGGPLRQVTTMSINAITHAALSPDGSRVAYTSFETGNAEIWVMNTDGSNPIQLTNHPAPDFWPNWTADGKWISFGSDKDGPGKSQIWKVRSSGGEATQLTTKGGLRGDWSPVENLVLNCIDQGRPRIEILDFEGKTLLNIPYPHAGFAFPVWSPDGRRFSAKWTESQQNDAVWIFDAKTGQGRPAVRFPNKFHIIFRAPFTKDGKSILVNRTETVSNIVLIENFY